MITHGFAKNPRDGSCLVCEEAEGLHSHSIPESEVRTSWDDRPEMPGLIRLWGCDKKHRPVTFMAESADACPACDAVTQRRMFDDEVRHHTDSIGFYRSIVDKVGELFGEEAHTADDGSIQEGVLALKVYPLVAELMKAHDRASMALYNSYRDRRRVRVRVHRNVNPHPRKKSGNAATGVLTVGALIGFAVGFLKGGRN